MKHSKNIDEQIVAFLNGAASDEDKKLLKEWVSASSENERQLECLKKIWKERSSEPKFYRSEELAEIIWQKGVLESGPANRFVNHRKENNRSYFFKIAAVAAIFMVSVSLVFFIKNNEREEVKEVAATFTHKSNPAGQKTRINLPDGSVVWLNSVSSITYPSYFSDSSRVLELVGEAYFEVKKDSLRPFTVKSGNILTTALGTSFNISAYPDENDIHVDLISGKVSVEDDQSERSIILYPNYGIVYNKTDRKIREINIDPAKILAWKNGILLFDGEDFKAFTQRLEKWYGVKIIIEGEPPHDWRIRGKFADEYLANILNSISFNKDFSYKINRKEVVFTFN